ncbi:MAG: hypothetical protein DRP06_03240 [Candidatus Aenigmatarchaeota archaeon]|nr:MAG: hypothetical protein DRP06_03240 [Candidatus Aenigmarchaeota archaeon]
MSCGGHLEKGESFVECLVREIKEETNLDVTVINTNQMKPIGEPLPFLITTKILRNKKLLILEYLCETEDISQIRLDEKELIDYIFISNEELKNFNERDILKLILKETFKIKDRINLEYKK